MGGRYAFDFLAHLSSLIFIGLLSSCLMCTKQADEAAAPSLIYYLVISSIPEPHYRGPTSSVLVSPGIPSPSQLPTFSP